MPKNSSYAPLPTPANSTVQHRQLNRGDIWNKIITQRCSMANSIGCFQWLSFVCLFFVCGFVNTI